MELDGKRLVNLTKCKQSEIKLTVSNKMDSKHVPIVMKVRSLAKEMCYDEVTESVFAEEDTCSDNEEERKRVRAWRGRYEVVGCITKVNLLVGQS